MQITIYECSSVLCLYCYLYMVLCYTFRPIQLLVADTREKSRVGLYSIFVFFIIVYMFLWLFIQFKNVVPWHAIHNNNLIWRIHSYSFSNYFLRQFRAWSWKSGEHVNFHCRAMRFLLLGLAGFTQQHSESIFLDWYFHPQMFTCYIFRFF